MLKIILMLMILLVSPAFAKDNRSPEWVSKLQAAQTSEQLAIICGTRGSNARFSLHERDPETSEWHEIISCSAYIGRNGWGKTREGDMKTPQGIFTFTQAFGINKDPGSMMDYIQVDNSHYWVGDSESEYYNQLVSTNEHGGFNLKESEHIIDYKTAYKYCLNISYNSEGTPGRGSAIFLHCQTKNKFTAGCVAIPEKAMIEVLRNVRENCTVIMDTNQNIKSY